MTTATQQRIVNGIDVEQLRQAIDGVAADAAAGHTAWRVTSTWKGGTRTDHHVDGVEIGGQRIERKFTLKIDEPRELCGTNEFANPQEYLMSAINACMMVGYSAVAALMGIELTKLEVELTGDIDLRGFLGVSDRVSPGYDSLRQTVRIAGGGTEEQFQRLHEVVKATSPNYFNITRAVPTNSTLIVEQA